MSILDDDSSFAAGLLEAAPDAIVVADQHGKIVLVNARALEVFRWAREELVGRSIEVLVPPRLRATHEDRRAEYGTRPRVRPMGAGASILSGVRSDGTELPVDVSLSPFVNGSGHYVIAMIRDASHRVRVEQRLRHMSTHDALTGLYNRAFFDEELARFDRGRRPVGIVVADLDALKVVNDTWGHARGDQLLQHAATSISRAFRAEDIVARLGGDEFGVLVPDADDPLLGRMMSRVRSLASAPMPDGTPSLLSLSLGATTAAPGMLVEALKAADEAMYAEKRARRESTMLQGDLTQVSLASVLSFLELEQKTGEVVVFGLRSARIRLRAGRVVRVVIEEDATGRPSEALLMDVLDWPHGHFEFTVGDDSSVDGSAGLGVTGILLEHARRRDEARSSPA